jgi:hypothetical protein
MSISEFVVRESNKMSEELYLLSGGNIGEEDRLLSGTAGDYYQRLQNLIKFNEPKK